MIVTLINDTPVFQIFTVALDDKERDACLKRTAHILSQNHTIKGFRPGKASLDIVAKTLPFGRVWDELLAQAARNALEFFLKEKKQWFASPFIAYKGDEKEKREIIGRLKPLAIEITLAHKPVVTLPLYKDIHVKSDVPKISDEEVESAISYIADSRRVENIDDAFAHSLGNFENLDALKTSIRDGLLHEKTLAAKGKARGELLKKIRKSANISIAPFLITREAEELLRREIESIESSGVDLQEFLKERKMSEKEFIAQIKNAAETRLNNWLILHEIAEKEGIKISKEEIDGEVKRILSRFSSPRQAEKEFNPAELTHRIKEELSREKVFSEALDKQITVGHRD